MQVETADAVGPARVSVLRCIVALGAALVLFLPAPPAVLTVAWLAAYGAYSIALALAPARALVPAPAQPWVDIACYSVLVWLAPGSALSLLFFFPILVLAFSQGARESAVATVLASVVFALLGRDIPAALLLLLAGGLIAYWAHRELARRGRLQLLSDIGKVVNPRLGTDHAVAQSLKRLLEFHRADSGVLVCARPGADSYLMYRVDALALGNAPRALTDQAAQALLELPAELSVAWSPRRSSRNCPPAQCRRLANLLETGCFMSVPFRVHEALPGRLFLTSTTRRFSEEDADFLAQAAARMAVAVDCLMLVEQLLENASQLQRSRISRDIHDTAVQPYIGIKLALEAMQRKIEPESPIAQQVAELVEMTTRTIGDLRGYVARLREREPGWASEQLLGALREHIARYQAVYGIEVELQADSPLPLSDQLASDIYQIVLEALSNIYKHTDAKRALVELRARADALVVLIANQRGLGRDAAVFAPRSIAERAATLGGKVEVHARRDGHDVVEISIPF